MNLCVKVWLHHSAQLIVYGAVRQTTFDAEPSYDEEDGASARYPYEAEQPAFGFTERDVDTPAGRHSRNSSAGIPDAPA